MSGRGKREQSPGGDACSSLGLVDGTLRARVPLVLQGEVPHDPRTIHGETRHRMSPLHDYFVFTKSPPSHVG